MINNIKLMTLLAGMISLLAMHNSYAESLKRSFAWPLQVRQLDPHNTSSDTLFSLITHYLTPLVDINPDDNSVVPALAEKWEISGDGKTITLQLRKDAYWSDGIQITAQQAKQSIERAVSDEMKSDAQTLLLPIKGVRARLNGKSDVPLGIEVLNNTAIRFQLAYSDPDFIRTLAFPIASPIPIHQIGSDSSYPSVDNLSSSGPYRLVKIGKHSAAFVANEKYFGEQPHFKSVSFTFNEYQKLIRDFFNDSYDTVEYIPVDQMPWLKENIPDSIKITNSNGAFYLVFKHEDLGGLSPLLRQLLAESLDYHRLNDVMTRQYFPTMSTLTPWGASRPEDTEAAEKRRAEATEKAKQLMLKNGYSKNSPMKVCINLEKVATNESLFNLLQVHLSSMHIQLSHQDTDLNSIINNRPEDICAMGIDGYSSRTKSVEEMLLAFMPGGLFYSFLTNQSELANRYAEMNQHNANEEQRKATLQNMENYLLEQNHVRALYKSDLISLVNQKKVSNYVKAKSFTFIPATQHLKP